MTPLSKMKKGYEGTILDIKTKDKKVLRKLMAMGVFPNSSIELIQTFPSYVFKVGYTQVAIDKQIASTIIVE